MNEYDPGPGVGPEKLPEIAADAARLLAATGEGRADGERKRLRESLAAVRRCADAVERRFGAAAA
ncbi:MAG: hypothetical protein K6G17_04940, partial [Oscillospiraceae bacterium]|nr:hypothetical protein [Oscillospiraceae bacterium]